MKRSYSKRDAIRHTHKTAQQQNTSKTTSEEVIVNNPASQAKLDLIKEKLREVEETNKVKDLSAQMVTYFRGLSESMKKLTECAEDVGNTFENWDLIFNTMGEMNKGEEKSNEIWVRFKKTHN
ncbi:uncharacterized protein BX663DRAFT_510553 [Cokeromyces recurvatus]|uniref:uncharacterized protein n=1 Tax=Cokeromyces recurvatus TaxID=90255 RepID=UPI00221E81F1|nr:uncharacterized protein BX663DRAFT_510553 [Cokeromyces recurvatus]KAI7902806.1 hypothetical protein BX663DRAFT_510553 [Cokeromyces recurvatus]